MWLLYEVDLSGLYRQVIYSGDLYARFHFEILSKMWFTVYPWHSHDHCRLDCYSSTSICQMTRSVSSIGPLWPASQDARGSGRAYVDPPSRQPPSSSCGRSSDIAYRHKEWSPSSPYSQPSGPDQITAPETWGTSAWKNNNKNIRTRYDFFSNLLNQY